MWNYLERILDSSIYSPHGICLLWEPELIWLHVISDALIALSYFSIPFALAIFVTKRRDVRFGWVLWAFAAFILACGMTHVLSIYTLWVPLYGVEGLIKSLTAVASIVTAAALWPLLPKLLAIPSPSQLEQAFVALEEESRQRRGAETLLESFREIEATETQIRQAQKMEAIGQLTGGIAHDFNNILTVITGTIEILTDAVAHNQKLAEITKLIDGAATRGASLIQHLLAFARKQPLYPSNVEIESLLVQTAALLRQTLGEHIKVDVVSDGKKSHAFVDSDQLMTAVLNLALNARDAMPAGGQITIRVCEIDSGDADANFHAEVADGKFVVITVTDTGHGIEADIINKVFDPFFTTKLPGHGTGLGLSMVYGFVNQSNGHVSITSEVGKGTTIKIYLPCVPGVVSSPKIENLRDYQPGNGTILVVEDDELVRTYVIKQIESLGYTTLAASNATEALAVLSTSKMIDLLFTDIIMAGSINGRQLFEKAVELRPSLKVLYTSGYAENALLQDGGLGTDVLLLAKPYRRSDLAKMIKTAMEI